MIRKKPLSLKPSQFIIPTEQLRHCSHNISKSRLSIDISSITLTAILQCTDICCLASDSFLHCRRMVKKYGHTHSIRDEQYYWYHDAIGSPSEVVDPTASVGGNNCCETHQYRVDLNIFRGQDTTWTGFDCRSSLHDAMSPPHVHLLWLPSTSGPNNKVITGQNTANSSFIHHCQYRIRS